MKIAASLLLAALGSGLPPVAHSVAALAPFEANYEVWLNGRLHGHSRISLQTLADGQWEYRIDAEGSGLARLAKAEVSQSCRFDLVDGAPRLLDTTVRSDVLLRHRVVRAEFDWNSRQVSWSGDIAADRRGPLPLQTGATNATLLNLSLALDAGRAVVGEVVRYPVYERGQVQQQEYRVGPPETVEVPSGRFQAIPMINPQPDKQRTTTAWYATDLPPTPVRVLQIEKGKPKYELRLLRIE